MRETPNILLFFSHSNQNCDNINFALFVWGFFSLYGDMIVGIFHDIQGVILACNIDVRNKSLQFAYQKIIILIVNLFT